MPVEAANRHEQFLRLFTTHEPAVRAFVRSLVPARGDGDDILQEIAITLWNRFDEFREDGDFRSWAYGIARFKVLSWIRDQKRDRVVLDTDVVEMIAADANRMDATLQRQREILEKCFQKISSRDRELLTRVYQPQVLIQDVAESSGRTAAGFYQWLYRVRQLLQECVHRELAREATL